MNIKNHKYFLIPYLIFLIIGAFILLSFTKAEIHLFVNQYYNAFSDYFFKYSTYVSEGVVVAVVVIALAYYKLRNGLLLLSSYVFSAILAQFFKRVVFNEFPRPLAFFEGLANIRLVEGVTVHSSFSFPSGHATASFALFFSLTLLTSNKLLKLFYFFAALLVAWSRIHLSQHFFVDIYVGSILGTLCTIFIFWYFNGKVAEGHKIDLPLKELIKKRK